MKDDGAIRQHQTLARGEMIKDAPDFGVEAHDAMCSGKRCDRGGDVAMPKGRGYRSMKD